MADPLAAVEKIVKLGLKIKDAVDTVRHNEEDCNEIRRRVLRFSAILSQLQETGMMNNSPAVRGALEDLEETLEHALELVTACQERTTIRRLIAAGELSKQLRRVKDDILNKVMLALFAIHAHTTVVLLTIQAGGHPLPLQPEHARVEDLSHNTHSTEDARSELNGEENIVLIGSDAPSDSLAVLEDDEIMEDHIIGSVGYMAPEYFAQGIVSVKIDVYGFGVTLLETMGSMCRLETSLKDNIDYSSRQRMVVVEILSAWEAGRMDELFDPSLLDRSQVMEVKRYTQVGLLCIQDDPADRPTMADVLEMLHDGDKELPTPKVPSFVKSVKKNRLKKWLRALLPGQTDR